MLLPNKKRPYGFSSLDERKLQAGSEKKEDQQARLYSQSLVQEFDYDEDKWLGSGPFSQVFEGTLNKQLVAVKIVREFASTPLELDNLFEQRLKLLEKLSHKNLVNIKGWALMNGNFHIVLEKCSSMDLATYLDNLKAKGQQISRKQANEIMKQMSQALGYLKEGNVICGNISPKNILIETQQKIFAKLNCMGLQTFLMMKGVGPKNFQTKIYSLKYKSPEQFSGISSTSNSDLWALGQIYFELLTGKHLINSREVMTDSALEASFRAIPDKIAQLPSSNQRQIIAKMLIYNEDQRITIQQLIKSLNQLT